MSTEHGTIKFTDLLPGCLLLTVWPCLVHADRIRTGLENESWYPAFPYADDYFMHIRSISFLLLAAWMLVLLIRWEPRSGRERREGLRHRPEKDWIVILPAALFLILTALSWLLSAHRQFGLTGLIESFETFPVICGYAVTFVYASRIAGSISSGRREEERKTAEESKAKAGGKTGRPADTGTRQKNAEILQLLLYSFLAGILIQELIGFSQIAGHDFWKSSAGRSLLFLGRQAQALQDMSGKGREVYLSFYNPNYAAVYLLLVIPILAGLLPAIRRTAAKILTGILLAGALVCLAGTGSDAGIIVLALLLPVGAALLPAGKKRKAAAAGVTFGALCLAAPAAFLLPGKNPVKSAYKKLLPIRTAMTLKDVVPEAERVRVDFRGESICLELHEEAASGQVLFQVLDENHSPLPIRRKENSDRLQIDAKGFAWLSFEIYREGEECHLIMYHRKAPWHFIWNGTMHYLNPQGKEVIPRKAPLSIGKRTLRWLSGRMYIWSATIPLLKKALLTGYGPESFPFVFPQNDLVTRSNIGVRSYREVILRPHSLYLQIAANSGLPALAAFAVLALILLIRTVRRISAAATTGRRALLTGIALAFLSFLLMGIVNDSVVAVTPLWILAAGTNLGMADQEANQ